MKKICICTTVSVTMKAFVIETAKYLYEKEGYDVTLICNDDKEFEQSLPEYIHFIPVRMARGIDVSGLKSVFQFIKIFKKEKFDLVQYSTPNAACYASIAAKLCGVPIRLYCQWGIRYVGLEGVSRKIFKRIEKMICFNSTDIRSVSILNKEFGINEGLYKRNKVHVVGNGGTIGVDTGKYDISKKALWCQEIREKYMIDENTFVYGFAGRISPDKGCKELLNSFLTLEQQKDNIKLFIVGPVDDNCGFDMEIIEKAKNNDNIIFTGYVAGTDMRKYYAAMDVLVHPTYREGFGLVIQEAGAMGVSTITTKIPGASEVMEDGISATHVEPKNTTELFEAMKMLCDDKNITACLGQQAFIRTKKLYDRKIMLENQRIDYKALLN